MRILETIETKTGRTYVKVKLIHDVNKSMFAIQTAATMTKESDKGILYTFPTREELFEDYKELDLSTTGALTELYGSYSEDNTWEDAGKGIIFVNQFTGNYRTSAVEVTQDMEENENILPYAGSEYAASEVIFIQRDEVTEKLHSSFSIDIRDESNKQRRNILSSSIKVDDISISSNAISIGDMVKIPIANIDFFTKEKVDMQKVSRFSIFLKSGKEIFFESKISEEMAIYQKDNAKKIKKEIDAKFSEMMNSISIQVF